MRDRSWSHRRRLSALVALLSTALAASGVGSARAEDDPAKASAGGPPDPSWRIVMVAPREPGEPLVVTGTVLADDGRTPVAGARLYVYQTDASGHYTRNFLKRAPRLRGWIETGRDGRYEIRTIKPGAYPGEKIPAHIHGTLSAPGFPARWIEDFWFDDDPNLDAEDVARAKSKGAFSPVLTVERDADGTLRGRRDFLLSQPKPGSTRP